jgi:hypothetical protein
MLAVIAGYRRKLVQNPTPLTPVQANRKTREGSHHSDRDAQFEHINTTVKAAIVAGNPAISVDTKKKELVGDFKNGGRELRRKGDPEPVRVHDFEIKGLGKVAPYGVYDIAANQGWVNVGIDADTAEFAVESIRRWWQRLGKGRYPNAGTLTITADCGGSNGARVRLWKSQLQRFADETGLKVTVAHLPPGTSKWNRIEHRLFAYISQNWRGKPLVSHHVIIQLIGATTTNTGLTVTCDIDQSRYPKGIKVTDAEMATLNIQRNAFQGDWNYTICPRQQGPPWRDYSASYPKQREFGPRSSPSSAESIANWFSRTHRIDGGPSPRHDFSSAAACVQSTTLALPAPAATCSAPGGTNRAASAGRCHARPSRSVLTGIALNAFRTCRVSSNSTGQSRIPHACIQPLREGQPRP